MSGAGVRDYEAVAGAGVRDYEAVAGAGVRDYEAVAGAGVRKYRAIAPLHPFPLSHPVLCLPSSGFTSPHPTLRILH